MKKVHHVLKTFIIILVLIVIAFAIAVLVNNAKRSPQNFKVTPEFKAAVVDRIGSFEQENPPTQAERENLVEALTNGSTQE